MVRHERNCVEKKQEEEKKQKKWNSAERWKRTKQEEGGDRVQEQARIDTPRQGRERALRTCKRRIKEAWTSTRVKQDDGDGEAEEGGKKEREGGEMRKQDRWVMGSNRIRLALHLRRDEGTEQNTRAS